MDCKICTDHYSCQYMQHRFGAKPCEEDHKYKVNIAHQLELKERKEIDKED